MPFHERKSEMKIAQQQASINKETARPTRKSKPFEDQGKYTQFHNDVLDKVMPTLSGSEWKILCYIIRHTKGFNKASDQISYSQIARGKFSDSGKRYNGGAGVKSDTTISNAIKALVAEGIILATTGEKWDCTTYTLNPNYEVKDECEETAPPAPKNGASLLQKMEQHHAPPAPIIGDTKETSEKETETHTQTARTARDEAAGGGGVCIGISEQEAEPWPTVEQWAAYARNARDSAGNQLGTAWIAKHSTWRGSPFVGRVRQWLREQAAGNVAPLLNVDACSDCDSSGFTRESILAGAVVKCKHPNLTARASVAA
jgi:phage replication O-like protein O